MNAMVRQRFLQQYAQTGLQTGVESATPHRLVQMLYEGVLDRIAQAKGAMMRKDFAAKSRITNRIVDILSHLQNSLDTEKGGEVANNLYQLYDYMLRQVFSASRYNDVQKLDEVAGLIKDIKSAWDEMPDEYRRMSKSELERIPPKS
jgi:flagellar protein FliS